MKKQNYQKPEIKIVDIDNTDLITTSGKIGKDNGSNDSEWID